MTHTTKTTGDALKEMRRKATPQAEIALADFFELSEHDQKVFVVLGLFEVAQLLERLKEQAPKG